MDGANDSLDIEPEALRGLLDSGADIQVVDVRDEWELAVCRLADTIDIPMMQIPNRLDQLTPERPVVVICHFGGRSTQVAAWLRQQGFADATSLRGGVDAWALEIDDALARY